MARPSHRLQDVVQLALLSCEALVEQNAEDEHVSIMLKPVPRPALSSWSAFEAATGLRITSPRPPVPMRTIAGVASRSYYLSMRAIDRAKSGRTGPAGDDQA